MKKFLFLVIGILILSQSAFAGVWKCDKVSTEAKANSMDLAMSCTDGTLVESITRPLFQPEGNKKEVRVLLRNVAKERGDYYRAIQKVNALKALVDADSKITARETDTDADLSI